MSRNDLWADYGAFKADGETWVPPGQAIEELGWTTGQLYAAQKRGCLLTDWQRIRTRPHSVSGRIIQFLSRKQINAIKKQKRDLESSEPGKDEITFEKALGIAKCSPKTLRRLVNELEISTRRAALSKKSRIGKRRITKRIFVSKSKLLEGLRTRAAMPPDRMTTTEAAQVLEVDDSTMFEWCHRGSPYGRIGFIEGMVPTPRGPKPGFLLSRADVEAVNKAMRRDISHGFTDTRGRWVPERLAKKQYHTTRRVLRYQFSRKRLDVQKIAYYTARHRTAWEWFYLEESLKRYFSKRPQVNGRVSGNFHVGEPAAQQHTSPAIPTKGRGRPRGEKSEKTRRKHHEIVQAWRSQKHSPEAPSVSSLAREFDCDRKTVRIALREDGIQTGE